MRRRGVWRGKWLKGWRKLFLKICERPWAEASTGHQNGAGDMIALHYPTRADPSALRGFPRERHLPRIADQTAKCASDRVVTVRDIGCLYALTVRDASFLGFGQQIETASATRGVTLTHPIPASHRFSGFISRTLSGTYLSRTPAASQPALYTGGESTRGDGNLDCDSQPGQAKGGRPRQPIAAPQSHQSNYGAEPPKRALPK